jgi:hypothetical protein
MAANQCWMTPAASTPKLMLGKITFYFNFHPRISAGAFFI